MTRQSIVKERSQGRRAGRRGLTARGPAEPNEGPHNLSDSTTYHHLPCIQNERLIEFSALWGACGTDSSCTPKPASRKPRAFLGICISASSLENWGNQVWETPLAKETQLPVGPSIRYQEVIGQ